MGEYTHCFLICTPTALVLPHPLSPRSLQQPLLGLPAPSQFLSSPVYLSHCHKEEHFSLQLIPPSPPKKNIIYMFVHIDFYFLAHNILSLHLQLKINFTFKAYSEHNFLLPLPSPIPPVLKLNHSFLVTEFIFHTVVWHSYSSQC